MPFPDLVGKIRGQVAWVPRNQTPAIQRCLEPTICVHVQDEVTLGPLQNITVQFCGQVSSKADFGFKDRHYEILKAVKTNGDGWVSHRLTNQQQRSESWVVRVTCEDCRPYSKFLDKNKDYEDGTHDARKLSQIFEVTFNKFAHTILEIKIDRDDPLLPADIKKQAIAALESSPIRVYVADGANFGNQAAATALLQTLFHICEPKEPVLVCADSAPIMGCEELKLTIYQNVRSAWETRPENTDLKEYFDTLWKQFLQKARCALESAYTDSSPKNVVTAILPKDVKPKQKINFEPVENHYKATVQVKVVGTYDGLTGVDAQSIGEHFREKMSENDAAVWVKDPQKPSDHPKRVFPLPDDSKLEMPQALLHPKKDSSDDLKGWFENEYFTPCFELIIDSKVEPYQRTIRNRFDKLMANSRLEKKIKKVDAFDQHDPEALGFVAASDEATSKTNVESLGSSHLKVDNLIVLQPFRWKRESNLWVLCRDRYKRRGNAESLSLPRDAMYQVATEREKTALAQRIDDKTSIDKSVKAFVYGIHQAHGDVTPGDLYQTLVREWLSFCDDTKQKVFAVILFKAELPRLGENAGRVQVIEYDNNALPEARQAQPVTILKLRVVTQQEFTDLLRMSELPVVLEGANTMSMAMSLGKPFLSVSTATTEYPSLGPHDLYKTQLEKYMKLLRGEKDLPEPIPEFDAKDPLANPRLSHFFRRVREEPWSEYFKSYKTYSAALGRNQVLLAVYRLQVLREKIKLRHCKCTTTEKG